MPMTREESLSDARRISIGHLRGAMSRALAEHGVQEEHAAYVMDTLISTSLDGVDTHGLRLFVHYLRMLHIGSCNPTPRLVLHGSLPAMGVVDADHALGTVAANHAIRIAIDKARACGISAVAVRNSDHFGAAGYYAKLAAAQGLIGLVFTNSDALVAPFNGIRALNGTNPIAMAAPGLGDELFALDMATSQIAFSKVIEYLAAEQSLEPRWAQDALGTDASISGKAETLLPLGGYKGQGLGMMVQILVVLLAGAPFDFQGVNLFAEHVPGPRRIGHLFICIDPAAFGPLEVFRKRLSELLRIFRESPPVGADAVIVPGDKEREARRDRLLNGIPLSTEEYQMLSPYLGDAGSR
jgi:LDH2 family malate/lactate/ureidoglycolate dehydrogenase